MTPRDPKTASVCQPAEVDWMRTRVAEVSKALRVEPPPTVDDRGITWTVPAGTFKSTPR